MAVFELLNHSEVVVFRDEIKFFCANIRFSVHPGVEPKLINACQILLSVAILLKTKRQHKALRFADRLVY